MAWDLSTSSTVTGYRVYYTDAGTGTTTSVNAGNVTTTTVSGLVDTRTYTFYAVGYNSAGAESLPSNQITYTVPGANTAPTISTIPNQSTSQGIPTSPIAFTVGDAQTAAGSLVLSGASSNPTLVPAANIVFGGSGANRTVTVTPALNQTGTSTITVAVSDGSLTASKSFVLTVNPAGPFTPVYLSIEAESGSLVSPMTASSDATASRGSYISSAVDDTGAATFTVNIPAAGSYVVWSRFLSIDAGEDSFFVSVDGGAEISFSTVINGAYSSAWQWGFVNADLINPSLFNLSAGQHSIQFRCRESNTGLDQLLITNDRSYVPGANTAPTISSIADLSTLQNTATAPIAFTVGDAQTAVGSLTVSGASSNPTLVPVANIVFGGSGANRTVTVTPAANQIGTATITVTVSDGSLTASDSFVLTVNAPANTAPTITSIADLSTAQNTATVPIAFTVGDAQTAAASLTVSGASSNPTVVPAANIVFGGSGANRTVTVTPAANQIGTATITVTVSDGSLTASDSFVLTVNAPANTAPTISSIANLSTTQNTATAPIAFTVGDAQTAVGSLTVSGASSNPTVVPAANIVFGGSGANRTVTVTPAANQIGTATITVTVSDGSLTASKSFVLTVNSAGPFTPVYLAFEAESAIVVAPMAIASDLNAAAGKYIASAVSESGTATLAIDVPVAGDYVVWCKILAPEGGSDSLYVSMDGGVEDVYDTVTNTWSTAWQWSAVNGRNSGNPRIFTLSAGRHTLVFRGREVNTGIDQVLVTNDRSYVPDIIFTITTPTPLASSITLDPAGAATVSWPTVAGKTYRVMYKNSFMDATWKRLHPDVTADGNRASQSDYVVGNRFYQVIELP
jgi:hypothetical protein